MTPEVMLTSGQTVKLGRVRPKSLPYVPRFACYVSLTTAPPVRVDYSAKALSALRRMYLNDRYGDCVIAGKAHQIGLWSGNDGPAAIEATDAEVSRVYFFFSPNDQGCAITEVLDYFRDKGLLLGGKLHKIDGYVAIDWTNKLEVQVALDLFGSLTLGINLPSAWTTTDHDWDVTNSGIVGGHDVCAVGYDERGVQICTWGKIVTITWAAFTSKRWLEECYAALSPDWYNDDRLAPNGVNVEKLKDDLAKLGGGVLPDIDPTPPPPPPEPPVSQNLDIILTGQVPSGIFGHLADVTLRGKATPTLAVFGGRIFEFDMTAPPAAPVGAMGFGLLDLFRLLRQYGPVILPLLRKYGPLVLQVIALIKSGEFAKLSTGELIAWIVSAVEALLAGLPLPPVPAPVKLAA